MPTFCLNTSFASCQTEFASDWGTTTLYKHRSDIGLAHMLVRTDSLVILRHDSDIHKSIFRYSAAMNTWKRQKMNEVRKYSKMRKFKINDKIRYICETENTFLCFCLSNHLAVYYWKSLSLIGLIHRFLFAAIQILRRLLLKLKIILNFRLEL